MARVLIVDDDAASREYLRDLCAHRGHDVYEAPDGDTALRLAIQHLPDAVFTDVLMPGLDGCELARALRSQPATADLPIVFTTAHYDQHEIQPLAHSCGVRDIIHKPAKPAVVLAMMDAVLGTGDRTPPDPIDLLQSFPDQHRQVLKAKLLQTAAALQASRSHVDRLGREVTDLHGRLTGTHQAAAAGVWHLDPRTGDIRLSPTLVDRLGLPARLSRREVWQRIHPNDRGPLATAVLAALRGRSPETTRLRIADTDGAVHDLSVTCRTGWSAGRRRLWGLIQEDAGLPHDQRQRIHLHALHQAHRLIGDSWHAAMVPRHPRSHASADLAAAYLAAPDRTDTGADWYDMLALPDGRILLSVGSVAGHRIPGPTAAGPIRAILRAYALERPEPADVLARLNHYLVTTTTADDDTYVTTLVARYDPTTGEVRLANAGHPPTLTVTHDPGTGVPALNWLPTADPPLGIHPDVGYRTQQLTLSATTYLCAHTDGLTDYYADTPTHRAHLTNVLQAALTTAPGSWKPTAQHVRDQILKALLAIDVPHDDIGLLVLTPSI